MPGRLAPGEVEGPGAAHPDVQVLLPGVAEGAVDLERGRCAPGARLRRRRSWPSTRRPSGPACRARRSRPPARRGCARTRARPSRRRPDASRPGSCRSAPRTACARWCIRRSSRSAARRHRAAGPRRRAPRDRGPSKVSSRSASAHQPRSAIRLAARTRRREALGGVVRALGRELGLGLRDGVHPVVGADQDQQIGDVGVGNERRGSDRDGDDRLAGGDLRQPLLGQGLVAAVADQRDGRPRRSERRARPAPRVRPRPSRARGRSRPCRGRRAPPGRAGPARRSRRAWPRTPASGRSRSPTGRGRSRPCTRRRGSRGRSPAAGAGLR